MAETPAVSPQAEQAGEAVTAAVENAETNAAVAIETAAFQVAQAQQISEDLARAAINTELGNQIAAIRNEVEQWRSQPNPQVAELQLRLAEMETALAQALERIADALTPPAVVPVPVVTPSELTPTPPPPAEPTPTPANPDAGDPPAVPIAPRKPQRRAI